MGAFEANDDVTRAFGGGGDDDDDDDDSDDEKEVESRCVS